MKRLSVPAQYLPVFCRELYQLVRSGIPIAEGLAMLREDETDRDTRSWLDALCRSTEEGTPLSAALRETEAFPAYMTDMVALAEETGWRIPCSPSSGTMTGSCAWRRISAAL